MTTKRKFLLLAGTLLIAGGGFAFCAYRGLQQAYTLQTARDARPDEVKFLRLPPTASHVGYWRDGINYWAEFDIPEAAFRQLFHEFQFQELSEPLAVHPKVFGDPEVFPPDARSTPISVSSGLRYNERWSNGGGYDIIYDRARSHGYYDFRKR